jgi:hypothetical protein
MLLAIIPVVIIACFICICKLTGFSILPKELSTSGKQFNFPNLKRTPNGEWIVDSDSDSEDSEDYLSSDEEPHDPKLKKSTKPLKKVKRRKKKQKPSQLNIPPNDPTYRILNGGLYD